MDWSVFVKTKRCIGQRGNLGHFERVGLGFGAICAVLIAALFTPTPAMAADWIEINGERYEAGASQSDPAGGSELPPISWTREMGGFLCPST